MLENNLFLKALKGEPVSRPPVWMMRQAGRYLPDFMKIKAKYDFFTRCQTPELATEITIMPIDQIGVDAAILFSDILVIPQAMGIDVEMKPDFGPFLPNPIQHPKQVKSIFVPDIEDSLNYVLEAIKLTKKELKQRVPLIGFAGAPWTVFCYMVEGKGSKTFDKAKAFCYQHPLEAKELLSKITLTTINYLKEKVKVGVNAVQIFDSWGGLLSPSDFFEFSYPFIKQIIDELAQITETIVFAKGCWYAIEIISKMGVSAIGLDWTTTADFARKKSNNITLQGNFDPSWLFANPAEIEKKAKAMVKDFGINKYIANLGHGILPNTPVENAKVFVETIKNYSS